MTVRYDCYDRRCKWPYGPLTEQELCTIALFLCDCGTISNILLHIRGADDAFSLTVPLTVERQETQERWYTSFSLYRCGLYYYDFTLFTAQGEQTLRRHGLHDAIIGEGEPWQLSCCSAERSVPADCRGAVMYQIFPDRFYAHGTCDLRGKLGPYTLHRQHDEPPSLLPGEDGTWSTDFFGGNIRGICEKLPYLASLGVSLLYLNPIFAARSNHRYDTSDYRRVDPMLGTNEDFAALCSMAHTYGMRILLDGVFSHTGSDSLYFDREGRYGNGAYHHADSPYRSWYHFGNTDEEYDCWWGIKSLPCVDELNDSFLDFLIRGEDSVIALWLGLGADGFRLDVADELPDAFLKLFAQHVKARKPDALIIGEVWEDASNKISYGVRRSYLTACELDSVMNYPFRGAILDFCAGNITSSEFEQRIMTIDEHYPKDAIDCAMVSLSTHDTIRALTLLGDRTEGDQGTKASAVIPMESYNDARNKLCAAVFLQFVLPGCPCIFYGDEAGLQGWEDPLCRRYFPWGKEDHEILSHHRALAALRRTQPILRHGDLRIHCQSEDCIVLSRSENETTLLCCLNRGAQCRIPLRGTLLFARRAVMENGVLTLFPYGSAVVESLSQEPYTEN